MIHFLAMIKFTVMQTTKLTPEQQRLVREDFKNLGAIVNNQLQTVLRVIDEEETRFDAEVAGQTSQFLPDLQAKFRELLRNYGVIVHDDSQSN